MSEENKEVDVIDSLVAEYKKDFKGLSEKQQTLLALRKVSELKCNNDKRDILDKEPDNLDKILAIIKASDFNSGILKPLILYFQNNDESSEKINKLYESSLISYQKVLENYKGLALELNINKALELSHLYSYMLWNGYFSISKEHSYKLQGRLLLPNMNSFDVIKGRGVCLAYAELLYRYLNVCGKEASLLNCKVPTSKKDITCNYRPEIERKVQNSRLSIISNKALAFLLKGIIGKIGNHAVTLIEENNKVFIYDPTNLYVLNVIDENTANIINGKGQFELKPFTTLSLNPQADPNHLFEKILSDNIDESFTRREVIDSFENTMDLIQNNINLLDDAYDNIHKELENIDRETEELSGRSKVLKKLKKV